MRKIGIDARLIRQTGVGTYIKNLLYYLPPDKNFTYYVYVLPQDTDAVPKKSNIITRIVHSKWHTFSEQLYFLKALTKDSLDLMHFTYFSYPFLYRKPFIITIHDLTPLLHTTGRASTHNKFIYTIKKICFSFLLRHAINNAKKVIVPSNTVKNSLIDYYGMFYKDKISVTYEGVDIDLLHIKDISINAIEDKKPFFIYIGNFYPHKNIEKLIKAFKNINEAYNLILIGPNDYFLKRVKNYISHLNLNNRIFIYSACSKETLIYFYKNAKALIHPSIAEGFGLPLIEASFFKLPVIASNIPIFKEILGDNYLPFNPYSSKSIADSVNKFINKDNKNLYHISEKDINKKYSFEIMAHKTFLLYSSKTYLC